MPKNCPSCGHSCDHLVMYERDVRSFKFYVKASEPVFEPRYDPFNILSTWCCPYCNHRIAVDEGRAVRFLTDDSQLTQTTTRFTSPPRYAGISFVPREVSTDTSLHIGAYDESTTTSEERT